MSRSKVPYDSISIERQVDLIIESLNQFQNISNNKIQKNLIENIKKEFIEFVQYRNSEND
jgi:hypothetical protein